MQYIPEAKPQAQGQTRAKLGFAEPQLAALELTSQASTLTTPLCALACCKSSPLAKAVVLSAGLPGPGHKTLMPHQGRLMWVEVVLRLSFVVGVPAERDGPGSRADQNIQSMATACEQAAAKGEWQSGVQEAELLEASMTDLTGAVVLLSHPWWGCCVGASCCALRISMTHCLGAGCQG